MFRRLWIAVFACALISFVGVSVSLIFTWIEARHVPAFGWALLVSNALMIWIAQSYLRFRMAEARAEAAGASGEHLSDLAHVGAPSGAAAPSDLRASA